MRYKFTVIQNGQTFFSTSRDDCKNDASALAVGTELVNRFPRADGFDIGVKKIDQTITPMNVGDIPQD